MKVIYIAGPYRAENAWLVERNIRLAEEYGFAVAEAGAVPLVPHSMARFWNGTLTDQFWLDGTLELMRRCDAVLAVGNWPRSSGTRGEIAEAERLGKPVFYDLLHMNEWLDGAGT